MEWSEKGKKALRIGGVTAGVYLAFRYILPLVIPFLIAYALAVLISPVVNWLEKRLHMKRVIGALLVLGILAALCLTLGGWLIGKLLVQFRYFIMQLSEYEAFVYEQITAVCTRMENHFCLEKDTIFAMVEQAISQTAQMVQEKAMPMMVSNSVPVMRWILKAITVLLVTFVSVIFISRDYPVWKKNKKSMPFAEELGILGRKLSAAGGAYVRTQGILMVLTSLVCVWGFIFMKSPYALLLGLGIGLMDALPLLGTGLVFIPWIIITLIFGDWKKAVALLVIYLICYLMREFLEPKLMGKQIGVTSLEMIISMYVGLCLFGLAGVILGPVGYLIIKETAGLCID